MSIQGATFVFVPCVLGYEPVQPVSGSCLPWVAPWSADRPEDVHIRRK